jgi:hypothetical protein
VRRNVSRRGSALLEAIIAITVLATSGTAFVVLVGQIRHTIAAARATERETRGAAAQLARLSTLSKPDLIANIGSGRALDWWVSIERQSDDLFDIAVAASDTGTVLLRTTFYRPDAADDSIP